MGVAGEADARLAFGRSVRLVRLLVVANHRALPSSPIVMEASLSIEHPLRTPPPDKPWARPTRTRARTVHSAILPVRLAGVLHGHSLLRAPHKHLQRLCKIWSLVTVRRITSEVTSCSSRGGCNRLISFFWKVYLSIKQPVTAHGPIHPRVSSRHDP